MLTQRLANIVFTLALIVACIWFAIEAQGFKAAGLLASSGLPSKFFPQLTLGFTGLCAAVVALLYITRGHSGDDQHETVFNNAKEARQGLLMLAVAVICYVIWSNFGFLPMALLMGPLSLIAMGIRTISTYLIVLVLTALITAIFTHLLKVQLL